MLAKVRVYVWTSNSQTINLVRFNFYGVAVVAEDGKRQGGERVRIGRTYVFGDGRQGMSGRGMRVGSRGGEEEKMETKGGGRIVGRWTSMEGMETGISGGAMVSE